MPNKKPRPSRLERLVRGLSDRLNDTNMRVDDVQELFFEQSVRLALLEAQVGSLATAVESVDQRSAISEEFASRLFREQHTPPNWVEYTALQQERIDAGLPTWKRNSLTDESYTLHYQGEVVAHVEESLREPGIFGVYIPDHTGYTVHEEAARVSLISAVIATESLIKFPVFQN